MSKCLSLLPLFCLFAPVNGAQSGAQSSDPPKAAVAAGTNSANAAGGKYAISYVKSDRKWKYGFRSEPYNKISQRIVDVLVQKLSSNGFERVESLGSSCCKLKLELLQVTTHPAMFKKPGMDVAATISVHDADGRQLYSKGYRGESRTMMNTYGHLIDHAGEDLVENAIRDNDLIQAMSARASKPQ
jgi:hypothetical protein